MIEIAINTDKLFTNLNEKVNKGIPSHFSGLAHIFCPHSTAGLFLLEEELLHLVDIRFFLDRMVPIHKTPEGKHRNIKYLHDLISLRNDVPSDERVNGHSHIRSLFFNKSELIPVAHGSLVTGNYQRLFFVELDPERDRKIYVNLINCANFSE